MAQLSSLHPCKFDVILIDPQYTEVAWEQLLELPIPALSADPSFVCLWVGHGLSNADENYLVSRVSDAVKILCGLRRTRRRIVGLWVRAYDLNNRRSGGGKAVVPTSAEIDGLRPKSPVRNNDRRNGNNPNAGGTNPGAMPLQGAPESGDSGPGKFHSVPLAIGAFDYLRLCGKALIVE